MRVLLFLLVVLTTTQLRAQSKLSWPEMDDFHTVMSKTFHPAEEGKLQPLRDNADALYAKARAWQSAKVPQGYNAAVTKPILDKLVGQCAAIQKAVVGKASDKELQAQITAAHETFHEIMEKCKKERP